MSVSAYVTLVYGVVLIIGGVIGYSAAQSVMSLVMGGVTGLVAIAAGVMMLGGNRSALWLALGVAVLLAAFMGKSFLMDGKPFMPRGLMFVLSIVELLALIPAFLNRPQS